MLEQDLTISRGAVFHARAWPLLDSAGNPLRATTGLSVVAKIRAWRGAVDVLHLLDTAVVLLTVPGQFGGEPVAAAQISALTPEQTAALTFSGGVYDLLVNGDPMVGGLVRAPWVISREVTV